MEFIYYNNLEEANPFSAAHSRVIDEYVRNYELISRVIPESCVVGTTIRDIEVTEMSYETLNSAHFHYSAKNNGASIEKTGLESRIGDNSTKIDSKQAIYFSVGLEAVLHNWDVWLKWRLNRFENPRAVGVVRATEINRFHSSEIWKLYAAWTTYLSSGEYRSNDAMLKQVFEFEKTELERSDYYILDIAPGVDYPVTQYDRKKGFIESSKYTAEIYGAGVSTDVNNPNAEQWNRSTELGKEVTIAPERITRATAFGKNDALSVLKFFFVSYLVQCHKENREPAQFALLKQFVDYCS